MLALSTMPSPTKRPRKRGIPDRAARTQIAAMAHVDERTVYRFYRGERRTLAALAHAIREAALALGIPA